MSIIIAFGLGFVLGFLLMLVFSIFLLIVIANEIKGDD